MAGNLFDTRIRASRKERPKRPGSAQASPAFFFFFDVVSPPLQGDEEITSQAPDLSRLGTVPFYRTPRVRLALIDNTKAETTCRCFTQHAVVKARKVRVAQVLITKSMFKPCAHSLKVSGILTGRGCRLDVL